MKKFLCAILIFTGVIKTVSADMASSCDITTDGIYLGLGVTTASENYDFNMQSVPDGANGQYMDLPYSNSIRNHAGMFSIGYKMRTPLFLAAEFSITLNQQDKDHLFHKDNSRSSPLGQSDANLHLQKGNDLQFLFKIGKAIYDVTSYAILGWHTRKQGFSLEYPYDPPDNDFRYANKEYKVHTSSLVYGLGFSYYMDRGFDICIEYTWKKNSDIYRTYPEAYNGTANLDEENYPRTYAVKNKTQGTFSLIMTKTFSIF